MSALLAADPEPSASGGAEEFLLRTAVELIRGARARHRRTRPRSIAVAVRDEVRPVDQPWVDAFMGGVSSTVEALDEQAVLLYGHTEDIGWILGDHIAQWDVAGMLLVNVRSGDPLPEVLEAAGLPAVTVGRTGSGLPFVEMDDQAGAWIGVQHLVDAGRRRIAMVNSSLSLPAMEDRVRGWRSTLAAAGLPLEDGLLEHADGSAESGRRATHRLFEREPGIDAVFAATDLLAAGVLTALGELDRRCPDQVAVVGCDDSVPAGATDPPLTTVRQPLGQLGADAAGLLLRLMDGEDVGARAALADPSLVVRGSA